MATPPLTIEVIGDGEGETILVGLPDGKWGVVDCFADDPDDAASHPLLRRLKELGIDELEFVCLTHPHDDHFRGMRLLLETVAVRHFWRPAGITADDVRTAVMLRYQGSRSRIRARRSAADEYPKLLRTVAALSSSRARKRLITTFVAARQQLYPPVLGGTPPLVSIESLSPTGDALRKYFDQVAACFGPRGGLRDAGVNVAHNLVSISLRISYGNTVVLLGGDVERAGWAEVLATHGPTRLASHVVKVSHHGSETGYCNGLWSAFASSSKPTSIITPFRRFGLPNPDALSHIASQSSSVHLTSPAPSPRSHSHAKLQVLLRSRFSIVDPPSVIGRGCRVLVDGSGTVSHV